MNITLKTALFGAALTLATMAPTAQAYVKPSLVVQPLTATASAEDLMLHADDHGSTYLYVEQKQGAQLAVFDVTDPAHIKLDAMVDTGAQTSFNFVRAIGSTELVAFRDGSGSGVIDLHKATAPQLTKIDGGAAMATEVLGTSGYLGTTAAAPASSAPRMVQVVETDTTTPGVRNTVASVTRQATRPETGTTFLLGKDGVTVVRQMQVERRYAEQLALWNSAN